MVATEAQILANRRNAQHSTGPKTEAGKSRSRRNALKHGLTGDGVALPDEDAAEIASRFLELQAELKPSGISSRLMVRRFAFLSVRLERCERLDTAVYSKRVRHAVEEFDDHRLTQVEEIASRLSFEPMTAARRLTATPEGIDLLVQSWRELRTDLMNLHRPAWTITHWSRMERLLGIPEANFRVSRPNALTHAVNGVFDYLDPTDGAGLDPANRSEWARDALARLIDAEIERLEAIKATRDPEDTERDRREATARCLFDLQPAMAQVRKYEVATERAMYKALKEFRVLEETLKASGEADQDDPEDAELASFEPDEEPGETLARTAPRTAPPLASIPETIHFHRTRTLDDVPRLPDHPEKQLC